MKHPQADLLIAIAEDKDGWEHQSGNGLWFPCQDPLSCLSDGTHIRRAPRTVTRTITYPEPLREAPEIGAKYWVAFMLNIGDKAECFVWNSSAVDKHWLSIGVIHSTKEAAIAHAKALIGEES